MERNEIIRVPTLLVVWLGVVIGISLLATLALLAWVLLFREPPGASVPQTHPHAWWSEREAGWYGGITGGVLGVLGGVLGGIGGLIGTLSGMGRARRTVDVLMNIAIGACAFGLAAGIVTAGIGAFALARRQPYEVYYPLLLIGGNLTILGGFFLPFLVWAKPNVIMKRYEQAELRKMQARDIG